MPKKTKEPDPVPALSPDQARSLRASLRRLQDDLLPDLTGINATFELLAAMADRPDPPSRIDQAQFHCSVSWLQRALHMKLAGVDFCVREASRATKEVCHG